MSNDRSAGARSSPARERRLGAAGISPTTAIDVDSRKDTFGVRLAGKALGLSICVAVDSGMRWNCFVDLRLSKLRPDQECDRAGDQRWPQRASASRDVDRFTEARREELSSRTARQLVQRSITGSVSRSSLKNRTSAMVLANDFGTPS